MRRTDFKLCVLALCAAAVMSSCEKADRFTVNGRVPKRVEFRQRELPSGFAIGASLPSAVRAVDLGLSVRWASMNLGAQSEGEFGDLYAWGEITPSHAYGWETYEHNDHHPDDAAALYITRYCFDRYGEAQDLDHGGVDLDRYDDAAYVQWGADWRMPTCAELEELATRCTWAYDTKSRTFTVTGPNGNSIRIPYEGVGIADKVWGAPQGSVYGGLWSSTLAENSSPFACQLYLYGKTGDVFEMGMDKGGANRCFGCCIRPVSSK